MNIAIIGCGPAGLASALAMDRNGHAVQMFERFDEPRPVGSGIILQPTGLAVLREFGLDDSIHAVGKRINHIHGISMPSGKAVLNVNYRALGGGFHGLAVHRAALFDVLQDAVQKRKIPITTGTEITDAAIERSQISLEDETGESYGDFDFVVDASGARSRLQQRAMYAPHARELTYGALWGSFDWPGSGFDAHTLEQRYVGAHTMIGVLPIGRHSSANSDQVAFFWSLKTKNYQRWQANGLDDWKDTVRAIWPETDPILQQIKSSKQMMLAHYGHATMRQPIGDRIVFVGDSAHSTSPQLGQGANMALLDVWSLNDALSRADRLEVALRNYAKARRWHVRAFQLSSLALTPFYQSDSRLLAAMRDLLFDPVSKLPIARRILAGLISGMLAGPPTGLKYGD